MVAFRNSANAPKNDEVLTECVTTLSCKVRIMPRRNYVCFCWRRPFTASSLHFLHYGSTPDDVIYTPNSALSPYATRCLELTHS